MEREISFHFKHLNDTQELFLMSIHRFIFMLIKINRSSIQEWKMYSYRKEIEL